MQSNLLRKKDVVSSVGAAKSTVADWIEEFSEFIETVKEGSATFYKPSAVKVLKEVKELRAQDVPKTAIAEILVRRGFPVNAEKVRTDIENATEVASAYKELTPTAEVMVQMMSQLNESLLKINEQDGRLTEMQKSIGELQSEVAAARESETKALDELKRMEERLAKLEEEAEKPKGFFGRLFGR